MALPLVSSPTHEPPPHMLAIKSSWLYATPLSITATMTPSPPERVHASLPSMSASLPPAKTLPFGGVPLIVWPVFSSAHISLNDGSLDSPPPLPGPPLPPPASPDSV